MNNDYMTVLSFDLSSKCIGLVAARLNKNTYDVSLMRSMPIIPTKFSPSELGFLKAKKKVPLSHSNKMITSYMKPGETSITYSEKLVRDRVVRSKANAHTLACIGKEIGHVVTNINPDIILVEKNEIFNGVLTSVLLGKVMGILLGIAGQYSIPVLEYKVTKARSIFNIGELVKDFTSDKDEEELKKIPDITKRALRDKMERIYKHTGVSFQTDDESDACVVFHYWLNKGRFE